MEYPDIVHLKCPKYFLHGWSIAIFDLLQENKLSDIAIIYNPELHFICQHRWIVYLEIISAQYHKLTSQSMGSIITGYVPKPLATAIANKDVLFLGSKNKLVIASSTESTNASHVADL